MASADARVKKALELINELEKQQKQAMRSLHEIKRILDAASAVLEGKVAEPVNTSVSVELVKVDEIAGNQSRLLHEIASTLAAPEREHLPGYG